MLDSEKAVSVNEFDFSNLFIFPDDRISYIILCYYFKKILWLFQEPLWGDLVPYFRRMIRPELEKYGPQYV